jgi:hypothetical protein
LGKYLHSYQQTLADHFGVALDKVYCGRSRSEGGIWIRGWLVDLEQGTYFLGRDLGEFQRSYAWRNFSRIQPRRRLKREF